MKSVNNLRCGSSGLSRPNAERAFCAFVDCRVVVPINCSLLDRFIQGRHPRFDGVTNMQMISYCVAGRTVKEETNGEGEREKGYGRS